MLTDVLSQDKAYHKWCQILQAAIITRIGINSSAILVATYLKYMSLKNTR